MAKYFFFAVVHWDVDSSVDIATRYEMDGPGIESWWGWDFLHPSRPALGPTQAPIQRVLSLSRGQAAGAWRWPPTPSSTEIKERVELYLFFPSELSWPVIGWTLLYLQKKNSESPLQTPVR
jgi:hypothetical protein